MAALGENGVKVKIWPVSVELPTAIRLDSDREHSSYDRDPVHRWWRIMLTVDQILNEFRAKFIGKSSPVHFFWGGRSGGVTVQRQESRGPARGSASSNHE